MGNGSEYYSQPKQTYSLSVRNRLKNNFAWNSLNHEIDRLISEPQYRTMWRKNMGDVWEVVLKHDQTYLINANDPRIKTAIHVDVARSIDGGYVQHSASHSSSSGQASHGPPTHRNSTTGPRISEGERDKPYNPGYVTHHSTTRPHHRKSVAISEREHYLGHFPDYTARDSLESTDFDDGAHSPPSHTRQHSPDEGVKGMRKLKEAAKWLRSEYREQKYGERRARRQERRERGNAEKRGGYVVRLPCVMLIALKYMEGKFKDPRRKVYGCLLLVNIIMFSRFQSVHCIASLEFIRRGFVDNAFVRYHLPCFIHAI